MNPHGHHLREGVLDARKRLAEGRARIKTLHSRGGAGRQVCAKLSTLIDSIVLRFYNQALDDLDERTAATIRREAALVAIGGYGRRQLAPFSDVDLTILYRGQGAAAVSQLARRLTQDICDTGLVLGQSVRTVAESIRLAREDGQVTTALLESRLLAGEQSLYEQWTERFARLVKRRGVSLAGQVIDARAKERDSFGETVYLLEPNIKRSRGGLRDIHLLRWLGLLRFGAADPDQLRLAGGLSKLDHHRLIQAQEFQLHIRNAVHFHASSEQDVLDRQEQLRLADELGYRGNDRLLPVEQLMRDFFWHSTQVWNLARRFMLIAKPVSTAVRILEPALSHQVEGDFRVGPREISTTRAGLGRLTGSITQILRLVELANLYDRRIAATTWSAVHLAAPNLPVELPAEAAEPFMALLHVPTRLGQLLRGLHELGVLERILPDFRHARCLLQFNQYHKYTVDEHCILAVERATEFADLDGPLGEAYRGISDKSLFHLALLVHDLGKGHTEDHSIVGGRIAIEIAKRLAFSIERAKTLHFLVRQHLLMSHLAFRRDTRDPATLKDLAKQADSPEVLQMLYVLSCADLAAVGPDVLTDWKIAVLNGLFQRTLPYLREENSGQAKTILLPATEGPPSTAALSTHHGKSAAEADGEYNPEHKTVQFTASVTEGAGRGIFAKMAGTLAACGFDIHSATIDVLPSEHLILKFVTADAESEGATEETRIDEVAAALVASIDDDKPPRFRQLWGEAQEAARPKAPLENRIHIDNTTSDKYTIIEVFTFDRRGLLYQLAQAIHTLGLQIRIAKIGVYLDQVVDVFYVINGRGQKVTTTAELDVISERLLAVVKQYRVE